MTGSVRGIDLPGDRIEEDPFAELAEIFESEMGREALRLAEDDRPAGSATAPFYAQAGKREASGMLATGTSDRSAHPRSSRTTHDFAAADRPSPEADFEAAFADALTQDMAEFDAPTPSPEAASRGGRPRRPSSAGFGADPRIGHPLLEGEIESAIRGLSAPANPRDAIVFETQSFAPDRVFDEAPREIAAPEMDDFDELIASELAVMSRHADYPAAATHVYQASYDNPYSVAAVDQYDRDGSFAAPEDDDDYRTNRVAPSRPFLRRRLTALAGGVMSLALVGAAGLYVWHDSGFTGSVVASADPLLIKADAEPYKVVPKDPGGRAIPNQNKAVYDRVSSPSAQLSPTQQALLTDAEEPMELPAEEPQSYKDLPGVDMADNVGMGAEEDAAGVKDEARIEDASAQAQDSAPIPVLQPRKVRTMVVRPDGKILAADADTARPASLAPSDKIPVIGSGALALIEVSSRVPAGSRAANPVGAPSAPAEEEAVSAESDAGAAPGPEIAALAGASTAIAEAMPEATRSEPVSVEAASALAEVPAGLPVQVADPVEVASIPEAPVAKPVSAAPSSGGYFVQISSQPSEALAQQSLHSLGSRFSAFIEGRSVGIQSAEIPGKGTFYRVRVATASKGEASALCARLKSAGGNCFVTR